MREDVVLCAANAYHQKYYLNPEYGNLPEDVQKELKLIAVDYVEEIGGVFLMSFNAEQKLVLKSMHEEDDLRFDDAKAQKKIGELATRYEALFTKLETYYQALETLHGRGRSSEELTGRTGSQLPYPEFLTAYSPHSRWRFPAVHCCKLQSESSRRTVLLPVLQT